MLGLTAFQLGILGLQAIGEGLQASAAAKDPPQPRETEQERQIKRQSEAMTAIRMERMDQKRRGVATGVVELLGRVGTQGEGQTIGEEISTRELLLKGG